MIKHEAGVLTHSDTFIVKKLSLNEMEKLPHKSLVFICPQIPHTLQAFQNEFIITAASWATEHVFLCQILH